MVASENPPTQPLQIENVPLAIPLLARNLPPPRAATPTRMVSTCPTALVYSENEFGKIDGKVANGLVRHSGKYDIVGVIDSAKAGQDAGEFLDGAKWLVW